MKKLSVILAVILLCTLSVPAFATDNMSEALISVKERVDIPQECTEFDSGKSEDDKGKTSYSFTWSTADGAQHKSVAVNVTDTGIITNVYLNTADDKARVRPYYYVNKIIPKIDRSTAVSAAESFFAKTNPVQSAEFDFTGADVSIFGDTYYVSVCRVANGVDTVNNASVQVDSQSGNVTSMSMNYTENAVFPALDNILTQEQAQEKFSVGGMKKIYRDFGNGEMAKIVWQQTDLNRIYATNGEKYDVTEELARPQTAKSSASGSVADMGNSIFTPEEQLELDSVSGLLTTADAESKLRTMSELGLEDMQYDGATLVKNKTGYTMRMEFDSKKDDSYKHASAQINAQDGQLLNFYSYSDAYKDSKADDSFIKKYYAQYSNRTVRSGESFVRVQNGIEFPQNYISCRVDKDSGKITYFDLFFDETTEFEDAQGELDDNGAYDALFTRTQPKLLYTFAGESSTAVPIYTLSFKNFEYIDAKSGEPLSFDGKAVHENISERTIAYSDVSGHFCETAALTLASIDVGFEGGMFEPDKVITQKEYAALLAQCVYDVVILNGESLDMAKTAECIVDRGVIDEGDYYPDEPLTRELAAKYLIASGTGSLSEAAQLDGIFKTGFEDENDIDSSLLGYVAIARALGIVSGADGYFYPKTSITRGQAAVMIYNYLK